MFLSRLVISVVTLKTYALIGLKTNLKASKKARLYSLFLMLFYFSCLQEQVPALWEYFMNPVFGSVQA
jgi:hypothetical protein